MIHLEICCDGLESARAAYQAGSRRIELCTALEVGGLTPSLATIRLIKSEMPDMLIMAMLRPRAGGFYYSDGVYQQILEEAKDLLDTEVDGLVFGFLTKDFQIDCERTKTLVELCHAKGAQAIFHRAFDNCLNIDEGIKQLIACGVDRVLTSGQAPTAPEGANKLRYLQDKYGQQIEILAGAGITTENLAELLDKSGVRQIHTTCKGYYTDPTTVGNISYSVNLTDNPCELQTVNKTEIKACIKILNDYCI